MLQNPCKVLGYKKNMVYKTPPGGKVNHIQPVAFYGEDEIALWITHRDAKRRIVFTHPHRRFLF